MIYIVQNKIILIVSPVVMVSFPHLTEKNVFIQTNVIVYMVVSCVQKVIKNYVYVMVTTGKEQVLTVFTALIIIVISGVIALLQFKVIQNAIAMIVIHIQGKVITLNVLIMNVYQKKDMLLVLLNNAFVIMHMGLTLIRKNALNAKKVL